jgi:CheY-like chemotaxis protein
MKKKILLVEDNPITQKLLALILEKMGLEMSIVTNGLDAIEFTRKHSVGMILMDYQLPGMDGVSVTKQLRQLGVEIPIIALTAYFQDDIREQCLLSGMNDVLNKPFRQSEIAMMLRKWLGPDSQLESL